MSILDSEKRWTKLAAWKFALLLSFVLLSVAPIVKADKVTDWNAIGAEWQPLSTANVYSSRAPRP